MLYTLIIILLAKHIIILMAQESFQVMISNEEYKELKANLQINQQLKNEISQLQLGLQDQHNQSQALQLQINKKDVEITFLVQVIHNVTTGSVSGNNSETSVQKSNTFQVLGQSVIEPELAKQRKINQHSQDILKKYDSLLKQILELEQRMESQEELITKLSQMNEEKNEALLTKETNTESAQSEKVTALEKEIVELRGQINILKSQKEEYKRQKIEQKLLWDKQASNADKNSDKVARQAKEKMEILLKENESYRKRVKDSNQRIRDLEMEISILKQGLGTSTFAKDETKHKIKALIDEYVREVEKNLKAVEGLSPTEIHELMQYEVKELVDYIPKSISNNK